MILTLDPDTSRKLGDEARRVGLTPEQFALHVLQERLAPPSAVFQPKDEWERRLASLGKDRGVSLPNEVIGSEGIYE